MRKGYTRLADIPAALKRELDSGRVQSRTLAESLAVDMPALLAAILPEVGLTSRRRALEAAAQRLRGQGVMARVRGIGQALHEAARSLPRPELIHESLATHPSDTVRSWSAYMLAADDSLTLEERLDRARRYAADSHHGVREAAWDSFRPHLAADLDRGIRLLRRWTRDPNEGIRRCAIEATRPRGVWCRHIEPLKQEPQRGAILLEAVRADPSRYVQRAAGNWLNDAGKTRPDWVLKTCARWRRESPLAQTAWIVSHGLRNIERG